MKTFSPLFLFACALLITANPRLALADDSTAPDPFLSTGDSTNSAPSTQPAQQHPFLKQAFAQLNLTDAQKSQIKQIWANVTDRKERRVQIMAVLTPDQKAKLRQLLQEQRSETGPSYTPSSNAN